MRSIKSGLSFNLAPPYMAKCVRRSRLVKGKGRRVAVFLKKVKKARWIKGPRAVFVG